MNKSIKMVKSNILITIAIFILELCKAQGISKDLYRCRQICYTRFVQDWHQCMDYQDCKNCWNSCDETLGPFPLTVTSASKQGSLVLADIAWDQTITNSSKQCLVTWEVSGGGLMGNLLTDSSTVELSLWSDTVYHVQVTCKNKETGTMRRSFKLIVDTRKITGFSSSPSSSSTSSTSVPTISVDANIKNLEDLFKTESKFSKNQNDNLRILKDSSRDNIILKTASIDRNAEASSSSSSSSSTSEKSFSSHHTSSVIRSKLTTDHHLTTDLYSKHILYAMIGSLVLFLGIVFVYILIRPTNSKLDDDQHSIDKDELIRNEMLPDTRTLHV